MVSLKRPAPWETQNVSLSGKKVFADVIKVQISRGDHSGFRWALNPIPGALIRNGK